MRRRAVLQMALAICSTYGMSIRRRADAAPPPELSLPAGAPEVRLDFGVTGIERWTRIDGQWALEEMGDAPSGKRVLVQRATTNEFNVIVAPEGPYTDLDVAMKFKPISGHEDASGGIVFASPPEGTTSSARMPWRATSASTTTTGDGASLRALESRRRPSDSGTPFGSSRWATMFRPGSTAPCPWITVTRGSNRDGSACGPRRTRSPRLPTSSFAV